jgi:hypothetical protein
MNKKNKEQFGKKTAMCFFWVILLILLSACLDPLSGEDPSRGTIILSFNGTPAASRAAAMSDIVYNIRLFNADDPADDGIRYGPGTSGTPIRITVAPGNYKIRVSAYLNGAFYAEGETSVPVRVTAGSTSSAPVTLTVYISFYLNDFVFSSANEIDLPLAFALDSARWNEILTEIDNRGTNVNLDLSQCKLSTDTAGGGLYAEGTFDPFPNNNSIHISGKALIKTLILPNAATAIPGTLTTSTFSGFTNLSSISIAGGCELGSAPFQGCNNVSSVVIGTGGITYDLSSGTGILGGFDAFADPSSTGIIPAGTYTWDGTANAGNGAWNHTP